jgi:serine/threonine protein phosphatase 1
MAGRLFVIGDVHGCARELEALLAGLPLTRGDTVAFVGDYIDRGLESRAVVDQLIDLRRRGDVTSVFLKGNHEDMCLAYLGRRGHWGEAWQLNGGATTLRSYGIDARASGQEVAARMPEAHVAFLEALAPSFLARDHLLVHAGIRPERRWEEQDEEDLFWIREEFIARPHPLPQTVVFGHTPYRSVLVDLPYKIGIDTGCVYGGKLTCLELEERVLYQVTFGEPQVRTSPLPTAASPPRSNRPT